MRSPGKSLLFIAAGLVGGLISLGLPVLNPLGSTVLNRPFADPVEGLAVALLFVLSGGFLVLGLLQSRDAQAESEQMDSVPPVILLVVGISTAIGGPLLFEPWRSDVTQGFRVYLAGGWALVGIGLMIAGEWWRRKRVSRYPLAVLSTGYLLILFYVLFKAFDALIPPLPYSALLLFAVAASLPGAWMLYRSTPKSEIR